MKIWQQLYCSVWLAFFCCMLIPRWMGFQIGPSVHAVLGLAMLALTANNARQLAKLQIPDRLKRINRTTAAFAAFQLLSGFGLAALAHLAPDMTGFATAMRVAHVVFALAVLAQSSSVATAYDMWEEREFETISS